MKRIIIDGDGAIFGRACSMAAKKALEGNEVIIVNSEKMIITGNKSNIIYKYDRLRKKGGFSQKGPQVSRTPHMMLKRTIRGMIPNFREGYGKKIFKNIKCYDGIPEELKNEKKITMENQKKLKFIVLKDLLNKI